MKNIFKRKSHDADYQRFMNLYAENLRTGPARCSLEELRELATEYRKEITNPEDARPHKMKKNKDLYKIVLAEIESRSATPA